MLGIVTKIEIEGLAMKVVITLTIEIPCYCVAKFDDGGSTTYSVNEVLITSVNMVLSGTCAEIGWMHGVAMVSKNQIVRRFL